MERPLVPQNIYPVRAGTSGERVHMCVHTCTYMHLSLSLSLSLCHVSPLGTGRLSCACLYQANFHDTHTCTYMYLSLSLCVCVMEVRLVQDVYPVRAGTSGKRVHMCTHTHMYIYVSLSLSLSVCHGSPLGTERLSCACRHLRLAYTHKYACIHIARARKCVYVCSINFCTHRHVYVYKHIHAALYLCAFMRTCTPCIRNVCMKHLLMDA
jgi:hypothetical protein